jgi:hypothetical protein
MVEYWVQKLTEYGNYIDHDPTEYFLPRAEFMNVIQLLVDKGYLTMEGFLNYEKEQAEIYGMDFVIGLRDISSFMDIMYTTKFETGECDWDEYPSLLYAAEYLASDIATPEEKEFYGNPERWTGENL